MSQENSSQSEQPSKVVGFYDHLDELRARLVRSLWVFMAGFVLCYFQADFFLEILRKPLFDALPPEQQKLYFTSLFENFLTHLKIAGYASLFVGAPYYFWELWQFIAPGLYPRERKMVVPFVTAASTFFIAGAAFAYYVLFPVGFKYFISYGAASDVPLLTISAYYDTALKLLLLFGLAFELPVLIVLLGVLGVIDAPMLRTHRRTAVIGIAVVAALFAPPDAMSMIILGVPLVLMYEGAIWVVQFLDARRSRQVDAAISAAKAKESNTDEENPLVGRSR